MEPAPMFSSVEDECRYWKERAKLYHKEWSDIKQEYDEYVEQSRQMEAEMDTTLEQKQAIIKDLRLKVSSLEKENESLKRKTESSLTEFSNMEKKLEDLKAEREDMKIYLRQIEQKNDDLERGQRIVNESLADFERMLDKAYEKNALLEMEVDEKEKLQEKLQRLMDETRDLKQELNIKARVPTNGLVGIANCDLSSHDNNKSPSALPSTLVPVVGISTNNATTKTQSDFKNILPSQQLQQHQQQQQHSLKRKPFTDSDNITNGNAMTPSSRTNALNIVADMLRKLNLNKTLLCTQCNRFRCVCSRILPLHHDAVDVAADIDSGYRLTTKSKTLTNGNGSDITPTATTCFSGSTYTLDQHSLFDSNLYSGCKSITSNTNSNIFKRFSRYLRSRRCLPIPVKRTSHAEHESSLM